MSRPSSAERGYDAKWRRRRRRYLRTHPDCCLCDEPATVPDHWPRSRRELVIAGVKDPDVDEFLRPLCIHCHNRETARNQPGGWAPKGLRRRQPERHPGEVRRRGGGDPRRLQSPKPPN